MNHTTLLARAAAAALATLLFSTPAQAQNQQLWSSYINQCITAKDNANWQDAGTFCDAAMAEAQKFGSNSTQASDTHNVFGNFFRDLGKYADAEDHFLRALRIREQYNCSNCLELVAETQGNLAGLYVFQGRYNEAETMARKAIGIKEQLFGSQHPKVANELNQLALAYKGQGRWAEAESTYLRCIAINEAKAPSSRDLADNYNNLSNLYSDEKSDRFNLTQAVNYGEKALEIYRAILPANHPTLAISYNNLGTKYIQLTQFDKALGLLEQGYAIRKANLPGTHPDYGQS